MKFVDAKNVLNCLNKFLKNNKERIYLKDVMLLSSNIT